MKTFILLLVGVIIGNSAAAPRADWYLVEEIAGEMEALFLESLGTIRNVSRNDNEEIGEEIGYFLDRGYAEGILLGVEVKRKIVGQTLTLEEAEGYVNDLRDLVANLQLDTADLVRQLTPRAQADIAAAFTFWQAQDAVLAEELYAALRFTPTTTTPTTEPPTTTTPTTETPTTTTPTTETPTTTTPTTETPTTTTPTTETPTTTTPTTETPTTTTPTTETPTTTTPTTETPTTTTPTTETPTTTTPTTETPTTTTPTTETPTTTTPTTETPTTTTPTTETPTTTTPTTEPPTTLEPRITYSLDRASDVKGEWSAQCNGYYPEHSGALCANLIPDTTDFTGFWMACLGNIQHPCSLTLNLSTAKNFTSIGVSSYIAGSATIEVNIVKEVGTKTLFVRGPGWTDVNDLVDISDQHNVKAIQITMEFLSPTLFSVLDKLDIWE